MLLKGDEVLLTRSVFIDEEFVNFPGGGVQLGESPIEALRREFFEETGLRIRPLRPLYASERVHIATRVPMQIVSIYWLVEKIKGRLKTAGNNDDVLSLFWAKVRRIPTREMFPADCEFVQRLPRLLPEDWEIFSAGRK